MKHGITSADNIEFIKDRDTLREMANYQSEVFSPIHEVIVNQRDRFMVEQVLKQCTAAPGQETVTIVLVVGMMHMEGIERIFEEEFGIEKVPLDSASSSA